jgi:hypothetical protein
MSEENLSYFQRLQKIKLNQLPKEAVAKKKKPIAKIGKKKAAEMKINSGDDQMDLFFASQRKKMVGKCLFCGAKTMKDDDEKFHFSIAHLLPKNKNAFPSVALNDENWIELCFWGEDCHGNFDRGMISWEFIKDSKEWLLIKEKLMNVLPMVAENERKNKLYDKLNRLVYDKIK